MVLGGEEAKYQKKGKAGGRGTDTLLIRCLDWTVLPVLIILLNTYVILKNYNDTTPLIVIKF